MPVTMAEGMDRTFHPPQNREFGTHVYYFSRMNRLGCGRRSEVSFGHGLRSIWISPRQNRKKTSMCMHLS